MQNTNIMKNPLTNHLMKSNGIDPNPIDPNNDFSGLDPIYLKKEGGRAFFVGSLQTFLAVHFSCLAAWFACDGEYIDGVMSSFVASYLWCRVIANYSYASKCNLAAESESE